MYFIAFQTLIDRLNTVYKGIENKRLTRFQTLIDRLNTGLDDGNRPGKP